MDAGHQNLWHSPKRKTPNHDSASYTSTEVNGACQPSWRTWEGKSIGVHWQSVGERLNYLPTWHMLNISIICISWNLTLNYLESHNRRPLHIWFMTSNLKWLSAVTNKCDTMFKLTCKLCMWSRKAFLFIILLLMHNSEHELRMTLIKEVIYIHKIWIQIQLGF